MTRQTSTLNLSWHYCFFSGLRVPVLIAQTYKHMTHSHTHTRARTHARTHTHTMCNYVSMCVKPYFYVYAVLLHTHNYMTYTDIFNIYYRFTKYKYISVFCVLIKIKYKYISVFCVLIKIK